MDKNEAVDKATDAIKVTGDKIDTFGQKVAEKLSALGSFQSPVVMGVLLAFVVGVIRMPSLLIIPLSCVLLSMLAKHFKS